MSHWFGIARLRAYYKRYSSVLWLYKNQSLYARFIRTGSATKGLLSNRATKGQRTIVEEFSAIHFSVSRVKFYCFLCLSMSSGSKTRIIE